MALPDMPRKMLPPPITKHNSTPSACTGAISSAIRASIPGSRPYSRAPISASPETFNRTRRYLRSADMRPMLIRSDDPVSRSAKDTPKGPFRSPFRPATACWCHVRPFRDRLRPTLLAADRCGASALELSSHLRRKIGTMAVNSLAEGKARKTGDANRRPGRLSRFLDDIRDPGLLVDDKDLLEQNDFLVKLPQPPIDHLFDDRIRLPARPRLLAQDTAFAVERGLRYRDDVEIERARRRDMHGQLFAEARQLVSAGARRQGHDDTDPADSRAERVMDVREDSTFSDRQPLQPAQYQILSDRRDQVCQLGLDRSTRARENSHSERRHLATAVEREFADVRDESLKFFIARHKVGLGIDFHDRADRAVRRHPDQPFGGHAPGLVGGRCQTLLPQPVDGRFDISAAVAQRPLAIHHPRASLFAQLPDQRRGHLRHWFSSRLCVAGRSCLCFTR